MYFVFGNLPDRVDETQIREFLDKFSSVESVSFFEPGDQSHSDYECIVDLKLMNRIQGTILQNRLNNYCWNGRCIHFHMLLF